MRHLVLLLVAVMSTANAATVSRREANVSCDAVAAKIVSFMAQDDPVQTPARITKLLAQHCRVDRWSYAARACIASSTSDDDADRCVKLLTPAQIKSFRDAVAALR
jgi:hypothetical protein